MDLDPDLCRQAMLARDPRFDGRFFTGVTSTGIYCRPICPARPPKPENCVFLPSAAAAQEAGFRPCLRCRPETAPDLGAWRGTSSSVARALALIEAGALDEATVDQLATRLGLGERQLRRLFSTHLGASPVAVAQTRRILLAKQLLHETGLSMVEIAFASGFGSVRRFNETFQALFGRPPTSLRRPSDAGGERTALTLSLSYRPPYDWGQVLAFLADRAIPGVERVEDGVYRRTIALRDAAGDIAVAHEPARVRLRATINFPRIDALPTIIARLRRIFDLAADPQVINAALARDPGLQPLVNARPGLRVPGAWDGFEVGLQTILARHLRPDAARAIMGQLAHGHASSFSNGPAGLEYIFPSPAALAKASLAGLPATCVEAIKTFATACAADEGLFERGADLEASLARLCSIPGIDLLAAHHIAMRALREPDAFPEPVGRGRGHQDLWRPWRAYAALHLSPGGEIPQAWPDAHLKEAPQHETAA